jgi:hypothetical protein
LQRDSNNAVEEPVEEPVEVEGKREGVLDRGEGKQEGLRKEGDELGKNGWFQKV